VPGAGTGSLGWGQAREWLGRRAGARGCEPAALASVSFPVCPAGLLPWAGAASARRQAKTASLMRRLRARSASLGVLPAATFLS
jgi:hypothetical protein